MDIYRGQILFLVEKTSHNKRDLNFVVGEEFFEIKKNVRKDCESGEASL